MRQYILSCFTVVALLLCAAAGVLHSGSIQPLTSGSSAGGGGGGGSFSGDVGTTSQAYLNSTSTTNTAVVVQDSDGLEIRNTADTTSATLTSPAVGVLSLFAGQTFTTDNITTTGDTSLTVGAGGTGNLSLNAGNGGNMLLNVNGTGSVVVAAGQKLQTDRITTTAGAALAINAGSTLTLTPGPTDDTILANGRLSFGDAATNPAAIGGLYRNGTHITWFNGTVPINLDVSAGASFSGDVFTTSQTFLNSSATGGNVELRGPLDLENSGGTLNTTLSVQANGSIELTDGTNRVTVSAVGANELRIDSGMLDVNTVQAATTNTNLTLQPNGTATSVVVPTGKQLTTNTVTSTSAGALVIGSGGGNTDVGLYPSGTGQVALNTGRLSFTDAATNPGVVGRLWRNGTHIVWYNGSTAINLDNYAQTFSGDVSTTTQGYLNSSGTGNNVLLRGPLNLLDAAGTVNATLTVPSAGVLALNSGQSFRTDSVTSSTSLSLSSGGGTTNISLTPSGSGVVAVASGKFLTTDNVSTTAGGALNFYAGGGNTAINLTPSGTGNVVVASGKTLATDTIASSTAATNLTLTPTGSKVVVTSGKTLAADTLEAAAANSNLLLQPSGSGQLVTVLSGKTFGADTIQATATNGDLALQPNGSGTKVSVLAGKTFQADTIQATTSNGDLTIQPNGTGTNVKVATGKVLQVDTVSAATTSGDLTLQPNGSGSNVTVLAGKTLKADTLSAATTNGDLALQPNGSGSNVTVAGGKTLKADTLASTTASTTLTITPSGTNLLLTAGKVFNADTIQAATNGGNLLIQPTGTGTTVTLPSGKFLATDNVTSAAGGAVNIRSGGGNTNVNLTPSGTGSVVVASGKTLTTDNVSSTAGGAVNINSGGGNTNINLTPSGTGSIVVASGKTLTTDNVSSTAGGAITISTGGGNTNLNLKPSGTGTVDLNTGRMSFADSAGNPATTGHLYRNSTHIVWYNGTTAINLDSAGSAVLTQSYDSGQQALGNATLLTLAHGFGAVPKVVQVILHCVTGEHNWSAGDEINLGGSGATNGVAAAAPGSQVYFDATNIYVRASATTVNYSILDKTAGTGTTTTNANWKLIIRAYQ